MSKNEWYETQLCGYKISLPIRDVGGIRIASDHVALEKPSLIDKCGEELAKKLKKYKPEVVLVPEAKGLGLANFVGIYLSCDLSIARKSVKSYMEDRYLEVETKSITTREKQKLILDSTSAAKLRGKKVCIVDDVISSGGTIRATKKLCEKAGGRPVCVGVIWIEGKRWKELEGIPIESLAYLPIWPSKA